MGEERQQGQPSSTSETANRGTDANDEKAEGASTAGYGKGAAQGSATSATEAQGSATSATDTEGHAHW